MGENAPYLLYMLGPLVLICVYMVQIEKQSRRAADSLERIAKSLEAKPLKLDDVIDLDQGL